MEIHTSRCPSTEIYIPFSGKGLQAFGTISSLSYLVFICVFGSQETKDALAVSIHVFIFKAQHRDLGKRNP